MQAEDGVLYDSRQWQIVKKLRETLPDIGIAVLPEALVIKAIDLGDLSRLMVSSQDCDALRISNL